MLQVTLNVVGVESVALVQVDIRMLEPLTLKGFEHGKGGDCTAHHGVGDVGVKGGLT
ncbi:hypothetical protein D3C85_1693280 [compost metagenome]